MGLTLLRYAYLPTTYCRPTLKTWLSLSFLIFTLSITQAQKLVVSGTVISSEDQLPVIGASVLEKGTKNVTITNTEGVFNIEVNLADAVLVFSYIGLEPIEMPVQGKTTLSVTMTASNALLKDVVVTGYKKEIRSDVSAAIASIKSKDIEMKEINDLIFAYQFAKTNPLTKANFLKAHKILSKHFLVTAFRGKLRKGNVVIAGKTGIVYVAVDHQYLKKEFDLLFHDIDLIIGSKIPLIGSLYFSSLIHLIFEKIHPFNDGNGRAGRLLEKWFLSHFIKEKVWTIESEKYYFENRAEYYENLSIGFDYESCDFTKALPFLLMLPKAL